MTNAIKLGVVVSALLIAATIAGWGDIEWPFYSGMALLLIAWVWSRSSLVSIGFERTLDADRVFAGDSVRERFRIRNHSRIPRRWIAVSDDSTVPGYDASGHVRVGSRAVTRWEKDIRAEHRGRYRLGPVTLESGDPFGLFRTNRPIDQTNELTVYPRIVDLPDRGTLRGDLNGATRLIPGRSVSSPIIRSVRQYVTGDPWNQIAWRASAKHASLLVKEFEPDPISDEWILLDFGVDAGEQDAPASEYAISLATSFALEWLSHGRDVGLLVNRIIPAVLQADAGDRQRLRILETLAVVEPYGAPEPAELIARFATRFSRATGLVVISTGDGTGFVTPLRHLVRRGVPLVVIAIQNDDVQPGLDRWNRVEAEGIPVTRLDCHGQKVSPGPLVLQTADHSSPDSPFLAASG